MNPLEYLLLGCLVVATIGIWVLINAFRNSEDAFENELGFQIGVAPSVKSLETLPGFALPTPPLQAVVSDVAIVAPRRPPGSKPPMLPANLTAADFATGAPWRMPQTTDSTSPAAPESPSAAPSPADTPAKQ